MKVDTDRLAGALFGSTRDFASDALRVWIVATLRLAYRVGPGATRSYHLRNVAVLLQGLGMMRLEEEMAA